MIDIQQALSGPQYMGGKEWLDKDIYIARNNAFIKLSTKVKQQNTAIASVYMQPVIWDYDNTDDNTTQDYLLRVYTVEIQYKGEKESLFFGKESTKRAYW